MTNRIIVLKFGSSVLRTPADLPAAVHEIYRWYRKGWRVVAVVSALRGETERLLAQARALSPAPEDHATAELLASGERQSAALLAICLDRAGVPARSLDPRDIGLRTAGSALNAQPVSIDRERAHAALIRHAVIVLPGFFGYDIGGRLQLLGRGGSDLSAVFIAHAVDAQRCRLLKDVDGVYESDPAQRCDDPPRRFETLSYAQALECAQQLIQPKAVHLLEHTARRAEVAALGRVHASIVGPLQCSRVTSPPSPTMRVLMLGLGTVGRSVFERLVALADRFTVVGALVRDSQKHLERGVPASLLIDSAQSLLNLKVDLVIDALPGLEPSKALVRYFLSHGVHVVSANKALIADAESQLQAIADHSNANFRFCAAVGGATPMIEAVRDQAGCNAIHALAGILSGTCNFLLSRCEQGMTSAQALKEAQEAGLAEADPSEDLSGRDAARKLEILAREAFGRAPDSMDVEPIDLQTLNDRFAELPPGETIRYIARAWRHEETILARLCLERTSTDSVFGSVRDEWNCLDITTAARVIRVTGRGAGAWPTTEAVVAEALEIQEASKPSG